MNDEMGGAAVQAPNLVFPGPALQNHASRQGRRDTKGARSLYGKVKVDTG